MKDVILEVFDILSWIAVVIIIAMLGIDTYDNIQEMEPNLAVISALWVLFLIVCMFVQLCRLWAYYTKSDYYQEVCMRNRTKINRYRHEKGLPPLDDI
jgi:hypothetical protein